MAWAISERMQDFLFNEMAPTIKYRPHKHTVDIPAKILKRFVNLGGDIKTLTECLIANVVENGKNTFIETDRAFWDYDESIDLELESDIPKIVIVVNGGIVQGTFCDQPIQIMLLDFDRDGFDEEEIAKADSRDYTLCPVDPEQVKKFEDRLE